MSCGIRKNGKKSYLTPAVSIPERMDGVELRQKLRCLGSEFIGRKFSEKIVPTQITEHPRHLAPNVLRITERASSFDNPNRAVLARLAIYVLEKVAVDRAIVPDAEPAARKRFVRPLQCTCGFKFLERHRITNSGDVFKNTSP